MKTDSINLAEVFTASDYKDMQNECLIASLMQEDADYDHCEDYDNYTVDGDDNGDY